MFWRKQTRRPVFVSRRHARPALEPLESRRLLSVGPGWSAELNGGTLSYAAYYPDDPDSPGVLTLSGTDGDDLMRVGDNADGPGLRLELNGASRVFDLSDFSNGLLFIVLDGGAGNDRLVSTTTYTLQQSSGGAWTVDLRGGEGDDALYGGTSTHAFHGGAGDDLLVGGGGRNFMFGDEGDDTLFGHALAYDGHGADATYDLMDGGAGDDVIHGGAWGWGTVGDGNDLAFDGFAADAGSTFTWRGPSWDVPPVYTAGDALLAGASGATAALVGDVLVLTGTDGNDDVSIWLDPAEPAMLKVSANGTPAEFDRRAVRAFVFDSRGGQDRLELKGGNGGFGLDGWVVRTSADSDAVAVKRTEQDPADPGGGTNDLLVEAPAQADTREQELRAARKARRAARRRVRHNADADAKAAARAVLLGWVPGTSIFSNGRIRAGGAADGNSVDALTGAA